MPLERVTRKGGGHKPADVATVCRGQKGKPTGIRANALLVERLREAGWETGTKVALLTDVESGLLAIEPADEEPVWSVVDQRGSWHVSAAGALRMLGVKVEGSSADVPASIDGQRLVLDCSDLCE